MVKRLANPLGRFPKSEIRCGWQQFASKSETADNVPAVNWHSTRCRAQTLLQKVKHIAEELLELNAHDHRFAFAVVVGVRLTACRNGYGAGAIRAQPATVL